MQCYESALYALYIAHRNIKLAVVYNPIIAGVRI